MNEQIHGDVSGRGNIFPFIFIYKGAGDGKTRSILIIEMSAMKTDLMLLCEAILPNAY